MLQVLDVRKRLGPILHTGEELVEKGEKRKKGRKTTKELQPDGGEGKEGAGLEEGSDGVSAQPDGRLPTTPRSSHPAREKAALGKETADREEKGGDEVMAEEPGEDDSDYMDPADAIPRNVAYDL